MRRAAACVLIGACLAGCVSALKVPAPEVHDYRLDYPSPTIEGAPLPVILHIARFRSASIYARESIVYRESTYATGTYYYHRWVASPASMIADLLARDFSRSGLYRAVEQGASVLVSDYDLSGEVDEIEERVGTDGCTAHLSLRVLLVRTRTAAPNPVVLQRAYVADEACTDDDPEGLVAAMSQAMAQISARIQEDVYAAIASEVGSRR